MTECRKCGGRSTLFLCTHCSHELQSLLTGLAVGHELPDGRRGASWLQYLDDAALGFTRLGESTRRSTDHTTPLPVNLAASQLLDDAYRMLAHWFVVVNNEVETLSQEAS